MFFDIINDALAKAKSELEKSVDSALGIDSTQLTPAAGQATTSQGPPGATNGLESAGANKLPGNGLGEQASSSSQPPPASALQAEQAAGDAAPPTTTTTKKKVIRKVIKKVPKGTLTDGAAKAAAAPATAIDEPASTATTSAQPSLPHATSDNVPPQPTSSLRAATTSPPAQDPTISSTHSLLSSSQITDPQHDPGDLSLNIDSCAGTAQPPSTQFSAEAASKPSQPHLHTGDDTQPLQSRNSNTTQASHLSRPASEPDTSLADSAWGVEPPPSLTNHLPSTAHPAATPAIPATSDVATPSTASNDVPASPAVPTVEQLGQLSPAALIALVEELHVAVSSRDQQLVRAAQANSQLQELVAGLQTKNEELALKSSKISEQDWEEIQKEFEQRLAVAERKVYALTKERDALKRGNEKLTEYGELLKEKDGVIKQVMEEGQRLSAKQGDLEGTIKKLRAQIRELEGEKDKLSSRLVEEQAAHESVRKAKAKVDKELQEAQEAAAAELQATRLQADSLLLKAKNDQAEAEERAREAANAGLSRKLRDSESRAEALSDTVVELREALDRQRQAAALREEMLKQDMADLERQCQAAELRHQELAAKLPDATRPLLRQIEAMQSAASAQAEAWSAAEQSLSSRIEEAEGRAAVSGERERHAVERAQLLQSRLTGVEAALGAARVELKSLSEQLDAAVQAQAQLKEQVAQAQAAARMEAEHSKQAKQHLQQAEEKHSHALALEQQARIAAEADAATVRKEFERRAAELEAQLAEVAPSGTSGRPSAAGDGGGRGEAPAMAAPGYRWVLVKEGEQPNQSTTTSQAGAHPNTDTEAGTRHQRHSSRGGSATEQQQGGGGGTGGDFWSALVPSGSGNSTVPLAAELESMRAALRIKSGEVATLEAHVRSLEMTRDSLSEELVSAAQKAEEASNALVTVEELRKELEDVKTRYVAAVELLGERDEALDELRADLMDVKNLYRDQIDFMVQQLTQQGHSQSAQIVLDSSQQQQQQQPAHVHKD